MNVRFGKCASCGAEYKVPDSFTPDMARCRECGGVAHFGPSQSPDEPPKFAAAVAGAVGAGVEDAKDAKDAAGAVVDKAKDVASGAADAVTDTAGAAVDKAKDLVGGAADAAGDVVDKGKELAGDASDAVSDAAAAAVDKAKDAAETVVDTAKDVGNAAAAGLGFGSSKKKPAPMPAKQYKPKAPAKPPTPVRRPKPAAPKAAAAPKPATGRAPAKPPVKRATASSAPKKAASGDGMSMLERLKAQKRAEMEAQKQGQSGGAKPAGRPAPKRKPAAGGNRPVRAAAAAAPKAAGSARRTASAEGGKPSTARRSTRPSGGRRGASKRRGRGDDGDDEENEGRGRRGGRSEKKSNLPIILGLGVVAAGAGVFFMKDSLFGSGDPAAGESNGAEVSAADNESATDDADENADAAGDVEKATDDSATTAEELFGDVDDKPNTDTAKAKTKKIPLGLQNPDDVDLTVFSFGPAFDTTDDEWNEMKSLLDQWMDPYAGAAGSRARGKLLKFDIKAFPVILNHMTTLELDTEDGQRNGDLLQRELQGLLSGRLFGWRYPDSGAEDVEIDKNHTHVYNKKVVRSYCNQWQKVVDGGLDYFIAFAKLDQYEGQPDEVVTKRKNRIKELRELLGEGGATDEEDPMIDDFDLDDLDVD